MEEKLRGQQFRRPTSPICNSLALNTAMAIFEHNRNFVFQVAIQKFKDQDI
jgi:hypothetical protein